jgi:SET domain-containing protein
VQPCLIYLKPSEIDIGGIGVFAATGMRKGEKIFLDGLNNFIYIDKQEFDRFPDFMQKLVKRYSIWIADGSFYVDKDLRQPELSMYLNNSDNPNLDSITLLPVRDICEGEELTIDYSKFDRRRL